MNDETTRCRIFLSRQCRLLLSDRIIANIFAIWDKKKNLCIHTCGPFQRKKAVFVYSCVSFENVSGECMCRACWVWQRLTDHMPVVFLASKNFPWWTTSGLLRNRHLYVRHEHIVSDPQQDDKCWPSQRLHPPVKTEPATSRIHVPQWWMSAEVDHWRPGSLTPKGTMVDGVE